MSNFLLSAFVTCKFAGKLQDIRTLIQSKFPFKPFSLFSFKDYDYSSYLKKYKQDEQDKFGSNQDAIIEDKLRKNNTKTSFFQAKEVFLRKYEDSDLTNVLNKNSSFIKEMLLRYV